MKLRTANLEKQELRLGRDLRGEVPKRGFSAKIDGETYFFADLDNQPGLTPRSDGIALRGYPFLVPIPSLLLARKGQWELDFSKNGHLLLKVPEGKKVSAKLLRGAALVNRLRFRAGVKLVAIDPAACEDCESHIDYLTVNRVTSGMGMHSEMKGRAGYTAEGAKAGQMSCLFPASPGIEDAIMNWSATPWHGVPLVDPTVAKIGVMWKNDISMLYPLDRASVKAPFLHPASGATRIPTSFGSRGEIPNPMPGTKNGMGCGFPVFILLPPSEQNTRLVSATLTPVSRSGKGQKTVPGVASSPSSPANPAWPTNSGLALFLPKAPLAPKTRYRARFEFGGSLGVVEWEFQTGKR